MCSNFHDISWWGSCMNLMNVKIQISGALTLYVNFLFSVLRLNHRLSHWLRDTWRDIFIVNVAPNKQIILKRTNTLSIVQSVQNHMCTLTHSTVSWNNTDMWGGVMFDSTVLSSSIPPSLLVMTQRSGESLHPPGLIHTYTHAHTHPTTPFFPFTGSRFSVREIFLFSYPLLPYTLWGAVYVFVGFCV